MIDLFALVAVTALASDGCFQASVLASNRDTQPSTAARAYVEYWHGADEPWRWANRGQPKGPVDAEDVVAAEEKRNPAGSDATVKAVARSRSRSWR